MVKMYRQVMGNKWSGLTSFLILVVLYPPPYPEIS